MAEKTYDFGGWASAYDVLCGDGRTILPGAFAEQDGEDVPLVFGHNHDGVSPILGFAHIEHRDSGPYVYCSFNDTDEGQHAKKCVAHGDIKFLSIFADHLQQRAGNVYKGKIKEVSLVPYGGANPQAYIDQAVLAHGDGTFGIADDQAIISFGIPIDTDLDSVIEHADDGGKENKKMAEEKKREGDDRTVQDILDSMDDDQRMVVEYLRDEAAASAVEAYKASSEKKSSKEEESKSKEKADDTVEHSDKEGETTMKYNAFENTGASYSQSPVICHADQKAILDAAKDRRVGTFKNAMKQFMEEHDDYLQHDDNPSFVGGNTVVGGPVQVGGFDDSVRQVPTGFDSHMLTSFEALLPEYREFNGMLPPQQVTPEWGWVDVVMSKTHKSPMSRMRTSYIDLREFEEDLRAKGYQKGNYKTYTGKIKIARRTTDPQTVYVKNALHKDDIDDMTTFDYVQYLYNIDKQMLNVELATAILFGDGREDSDPDKIFEEHIRPIWTDDDIYTIHYDMTNEADSIQGAETRGYFGPNYLEAEALVNACLYARETYKGTGTPDMFIEQHKLNVMLLARDRNGRRIYSSRAELATALNVGNIYVCEKMKNKVRTKGEGLGAKQMKLNAILVNLADYAIGQVKGGQVAHFTQFDIDFNQEKSLIETRCSGSLTRLYSAIVIEEEVQSVSPSPEPDVDPEEP